jgi:hypothetical protein
MNAEERAQLIADLTLALQAVPKKELTEEEMQWVRLAIAAEARKIKFRDAVIEKSLTGLVWACVVGVGYVFVDFLHNRGLKL